ncbi:MAG: helix-turn-helix domain-containing protein [Ruminococcaceae bacterium]|nr:helix-turn-helix domain-containing protein [Oscillospiraceae bacterium]
MNKTGERIYNLRIKNNMSQGNLADMLDVSRQTVSKWENNICMPDTEKLIQLSEVFKVSTDFILKGKEKNEPVYIYVNESDSKKTTAYNERIIRKYIGIVLAVIFSILTLLSLLFRGYFLTIIPAAVVLLGILFAKNAKHPWLITLWTSYIVTMAVLPFISAINLFYIFEPIIYKEGYTDHLLLAWGVWVILAVLVICTVMAVKKTKE